MAIINKFFIRRFREVIVDVQPGLFEDGGASTFQLDDPAGGNFGTSDFLSTVKRVVLLGEIVKNVVDTNPRNLRPDPIPYGRFFQLTDDDYQNAINTGDIVINPRTRGTEEVIGWVELGKSFPSLYYQDCIIGNSSGKQPRVDNYFDLNELELSVFTVSGQGNGGGALQRTGTWNINESMGNWGTIPYPSQQFVPFDEYMRAVVFNNGNIGQDSFTTLAERGLNQIPLLIADRVENFESNSTTVLTPSFSNPVVSAQSAEKTVYARNRRFILDGFKPGTIEFRSLTATCIPIATVAPPPPPPPSIVDEGVTEDEEEFTQDGYISESESPDTELETIDEVNELGEILPINPDDLKGCSRGAVMPSRIFYKGNYLATGSVAQFGEAAGPVSGSTLYEGVSDNDVFSIQLLNERVSEDLGIRDPRTLLGNSLVLPNGTLKNIVNSNECYVEITDDYRDKDGDHPEYVGPIVVNYQENLRKKMMNTFFTDSPLLFLGHGSDGYEYFSDGNSYLELHGESVFGCGEKFSIADIPEVFNAMYPQPIYKSVNIFGGLFTRDGELIFGKSESEDVKFYRRTFERMTNLPQSLIKTAEDWLGEDAIPARLKEERGTISDLFNDFTLGVPDLDFSLVGTDETEKILNEVIYAAIGAAIGVGAAYALASDSKKYELPQSGIGPPQEVTDWGTILNNIDLSTELITAGAFAGYTLAQLLDDEEKIYRDSLGSTKPRPRAISRYRSFNSFWTRNGLRNVYADTSEKEFVSVRKLSGRATGTNVPEGDDIGDVPSEVNSTSDFSLTANGTDQSIYDNVIWESNTLRALRLKQSRYAYPSRWKAMMRPIYSDLWHDKEQIKPQSVSTRKYLGENILELELGDYESHRRNFGMQKNLYDYIDDALSIRIHDDLFNEDFSQELREFSFFQSAVNALQFQVRSLFDQRFANTVPFAVQQYDMDVGRIVTQVENFSDYGSYLDFINGILNVYRNLSETYRQLFPDSSGSSDILQNLNNFFNSIGNFIESFTTNPGETIGDAGKQIGEYLLDFGQQLLTNTAIQLADTVTNYVVTSLLSFIDQELNRSNPERSSFTPRRVFKKGSVYLRSKSGLYYTNKQPCPIIFLGFNDNNVMSSFAEYNKQLECLGTLSKEDLFGTVKYVNPKYNPFLLDSYSSNISIIQEINPTLGGVSQQLDRFKEAFDVVVKTQMREDTIPTINKRPRQYGKNPFLDIFYLNLIPEAFANNPRTAPYTHRTSTPMPYRIPNQNDWVGNRVFTKDFSKPSYFPPYWNEPEIREGRPDVNYKDLAMYEHGDLLFMNRQPSTILEAKDRWSMSMELFGEDHVVILEDKTRILDIYFGLMQMHIYGVPWDELVTYIKEAKQAISIGTENDFFTNQQIPVASHLKSSIDLNKLEKLWEKIEARINYSSPLQISSDGYWTNVQPIPALDTITNIDEFFIGLFTANSNLRRKIGLFNNTDKQMTIKEMVIVNESPDDLDIYGKDAASMFFVGENISTNISTNGILDFTVSKSTVSLPPFNATTSETKYTNVWFVPYGAQPGKRYSARLQVIADVGGEEYVFSQLLVAEVENPASVKNWSSQLLSLPIAISWGTISNIVSFEDDGVSVELGNLAKENILVESFNIVDERLLDQNENDITNTLSSDPDFFTFEIGEENTSIKSINWNKTLTKRIVNLVDTSNEIEDFENGPIVYVNKNRLIGTNSYKQNCIYTGTCEVTYSLAPRIGETERVVKTSTFELIFSTIS